jgi:hypothetical protein
MANYLRTALQNVIGKLLTICTLWQTLQDRVYTNNPHHLQEFKDNIQREIAYISG